MINRIMQNYRWSNRIGDFLNTLHYSCYIITGKPIKFEYFVNPNFNNGHKNIRIVNGKIADKWSTLN